jgi:hypothetical protein
MKPTFPIALFLASAVATLGAFADDRKQSPAAPLAVPEDVHVQPRRPGFAPHPSEVDDLQRRITDFNAKQQAPDAMFDRKLNICRRC